MAENFCVAYTKCKPHNARTEDIYSWICHGEQSACHVVYYRQGWAPVYARLSYGSFKASETGHFIVSGPSFPCF